jgi:hypothetical protein
MQAVGQWRPFQLAVTLMATKAVFSFLWLLFVAIIAIAGGPGIPSLWRGSGDLFSWLMLLSTGILPWGLGTVLQLLAQRRVSSIATQLILSSSPVLTIGLTYLPFLGPSEHDLTPMGIVGTLKIILAMLVGSFSGVSKERLKRMWMKIAMPIADCIERYITKKRGAREA